MSGLPSLPSLGGWGCSGLSGFLGSFGFLGVLRILGLLRLFGLLVVGRLLGGEDAVFVSTDELVDVVDEGYGVDGRRGADLRDGVDHLHEPDVSGV